MRRKKKSEYDLLMDEIYEFTDKVVGTLNRIYIANFNKLKSISYSELNIMWSVKEVYEIVIEKTKKYYLLLARKTYESLCRFYEIDYLDDMITVYWLMEELEKYDPVTKYVYTHEVERKEARLVEAMIAVENKAAEVEAGLKTWFLQAKQYADNVVNAAMEKFINEELEEDVIELMWTTEEDERVCVECESREGQVYPKEEYPPKPHLRCRCYPTPVLGNGRKKNNNRTRRKNTPHS